MSEQIKRQRVRRVEIGLVEFVRLAFTLLASQAHENEIGDCSATESPQDILSDVQHHSMIKLTMDQLDSLVFHYKQAILNRLDLRPDLKLLPLEYQSLMKKIQAYLPDKVKRNMYGELCLTGYNHELDEARARHMDFRHTIRKFELEDNGLEDESMADLKPLDEEPPKEEEELPSTTLSASNIVVVMPQ